MLELAEAGVMCCGHFKPQQDPRDQPSLLPSDATRRARSASCFNSLNSASALDLETPAVGLVHQHDGGTVVGPAIADPVLRVSPLHPLLLFRHAGT